MNRSHTARVRAVPAGHHPLRADPRPAGENPSEPFLAVRAAHWRAPVAGGSPGWPGTPHLLAELVRAEYRGGGPATVPAVFATPRDLVLARLRRLVRAGGVPTPAECVRLLEDGDHARGAVFDAWPDVVRRFGPTRSEAALSAGLRTGNAPEAAVAAMLDLAAAAGLRPLTRPELRAAATAPGRRTRHAAWRLLRATGGRSLIPDVRTAGDAYERALLALLGRDPSADRVRAAPRRGVVVAQSMLLGRLDRPGEGMSGGLGVLLGSLGDALAGTAPVARVLTVVTACTPELEADPVLLRRRAPGHWVLRIPVDSGSQLRPDESGRHREAMAWWTAELFARSAAPVDVLHVRYADDGSLALAEGARRAGTRVVFTATPDPHRQITERYDTPAADGTALRDDLHRVFVADRLVGRADRVVGIAGRDGGAPELLRYYPQLADRDGGGAPSAPPEGIPPYLPPPREAARRAELLRTVDRAVAAVPEPADGGAAVLLSVGRLHPVKQQDLLVRSWIGSGCHRHAALVLVGGSPHDGDPVERAVRARVEDALRACPEARRRLVLLPALSNAEVRMLERGLADPARRVPARYVCASAKEEFGLGILEAMEAGLLAAGPLRGGVPHYLVDGHNGLLIDTSCAKTLGEGLVRLLAVDDASASEMAARARTLVRTTFSSAAMAGTLAGHYAEVAAARAERPLATVR
ncbi:glycosyltransferase [Streptomyces filamentosus]|uniref:glycosyltransferase n=1 Tax=Streptomyces filamentosus TaxID=67294 RepID=UPI00123957C6|nr:glycosyltransferase [Streptomyces filamentosus]KAA6210988.1 glycosyltransferase [Streptomyces filamentosus]